VAGKPTPKRRSRRPKRVSLDIFGDRWSLLIIRDLMLRGYRTFCEFQHARDGIPAYIRAGRLGASCSGCLPRRLRMVACD